MGLLAPSHRAESGYRFYADEDLLRLQEILALKFLGLTLEEVQVCLRVGPKRLETVLQRQRTMMLERRRQIDAVIEAIDETQDLMEAGRCDWEAIARVIKVIQMQEDKEAIKRQWVEKTMKDPLIAESYSEAAIAKLSETGAFWNEEKQKEATAQWMHVASEARRLAAAGADPAGPEAQAVAKLKYDLLQAFTQGDPGIEAGLKSYRSRVAVLPADQRPWDEALFDPGPEGGELLEKALALYRQRRAD